MKNKSIRRCINKHVKALNKVMDLYVQGMASFANKLNNGGGRKINLAKSFSENSSLSTRNSETDFRELLKVSSTHVVNDRQEFLRGQQSATTTEAAKNVQRRRSQSVVIGRIDEDHVCDFRD
ncbi:hypothetical protein POM88_020919 [Heracleum sosnowskyi]|uniref:Uncharacterized protein n=1 Tax=Heracleum sosnowskyi TaxID=360622 RepID=A0AAD8ICF4_9APIA|nr:hypothetical protein POM88_020919 [Heracleum sosnowskyi]